MRLFVALHLDPEIRSQLRVALAQLRPLDRAAAVKWVEADAIHLTLRFLGEVPAPQVAALLAAFGAAIRGLPAPAIALGGVGAFPDLRRPRVLWAGLVTPGTALADLQRAVEAVAVGAGWEPEGRAFQPHLTLGRVRVDRRGPPAKLDAELLERLREVRFESAIPKPQPHVALIRSHLGPGGSRYEDLQVWDLAQP